MIPRLKNQVRADLCKDCICEYYGVDNYELNGKHGKQRICDARHVYWYFLKDYFDETFEGIGLVFNTDHSTIIHGVMKVKHSLALMKDIENIKAMMEGEDEV